MILTGRNRSFEKLEVVPQVTGRAPYHAAKNMSYFSLITLTASTNSFVVISRCCGLPTG